MTTLLALLCSPRLRRLALLAPFFAAASPPAFAAPPAGLPIEHHSLANGMRLVFAPDPSLPDVVTMVRYEVGSADDPQGKEGLAHVAEHLMFDGTMHVGPGDHVKRVEAVGGRAFGMTDPDATLLIDAVPPGHLPLVFWLESDRMGFLTPRLTRTKFDRAWDAADAELAVEHKTGAANAGDEAALSEVFPASHPYHRAPSARAGLGIFGIDDVTAHIQKWFTPANVTLVVVGRFDPKEALSLAETYFGGLPSTPPPDRPAARTDWRVPDVRLDVAASVARDRVAFFWLTPPIWTKDDLALDVAAMILSGPGGRLQRELVDTKLAERVEAHESSKLRGSDFMVAATVARGVDPEVVASKIEQIVNDLGTNLTGDEAERARRNQADSLLSRLETSWTRAQVIDDAPPSDRIDLGSYALLRAPEVMRAVREHLVPSHRVVVVARDDQQSPWYGVVVRREERGQ